MESGWKQLSEWIVRDLLRPVIGEVFPLEKAREAYLRLREGKNVGKLVLKVS